METKEIENLKVGDKIYTKYNNLGGGYSYIFDDVERITKTLIITKSNKRLENNGHYATQKLNARFQPNLIFKVVTNEIIKDDNRIKEEYKIIKWFDEKKFTLEDKKKIYNLIK